MLQWMNSVFVIKRLNPSKMDTQSPVTGYDNYSGGNCNERVKAAGGDTK